MLAWSFRSAPSLYRACTEPRRALSSRERASFGPTDPYRACTGPVPSRTEAVAGFIRSYRSVACCEPVPAQVIPGHEARSVESLCWAAGERLFGAGLGGDITEYDLSRLSAARGVDGGGGPIWSMAANGTGTRLAVSPGRSGCGAGGEGPAVPRADPEPRRSAARTALLRSSKSFLGGSSLSGTWTGGKVGPGCSISPLSLRASRSPRGCRAHGLSHGASLPRPCPVPVLAPLGHSHRGWLHRLLPRDRCHLRYLLHREQPHPTPRQPPAPPCDPPATPNLLPLQARRCRGSW